MSKISCYRNIERKNIELQMKNITQYQNGEISKDIFNIKSMIYAIKPHGKAWRWGYVKTLRKALKLLEDTDE